MTRRRRKILGNLTKNQPRKSLRQNKQNSNSSGMPPWVIRERRTFWKRCSLRRRRKTPNRRKNQPELASLFSLCLRVPAATPLPCPPVHRSGEGIACAGLPASLPRDPILDPLKINHLPSGTLDSWAESMLSESPGSALAGGTCSDQARNGDRRQILTGAVGWKIL